MTYTFTLSDFTMESSFRAYTSNYGGYVERGYDNIIPASTYKTFTTSTIPSGFSLLYAKLYATVSLGTYGGTAKQYGSTTLSGLNVAAAFTGGSNTSIQYYWLTGTGGTYPATPPLNQIAYITRYATSTWTDVYLEISVNRYMTKWYDGSSWRLGEPYVYNGTDWVRGASYVYNGSSWKAGYEL